ncbi:MAG: DUF418 domain-containing protein [Candidatus Zixiibacteriota bacterium]
MDTLNQLSPVNPTERMLTLDALRGFALLGILVINIEYFALPGSVFFDPRIAGGFEGLSKTVWQWSTVFFYEKMMSIFAMLFGAGIVLIQTKGEKTGLKPGKIYYGRTLWLLFIGLVHSYLFWYGDILVPYAVCGLILFLFRRRSSKFLIIFGAILLLFGALLQLGAGFQFAMFKDAAKKVEMAQSAGKTPEPIQAAMSEAWRSISTAFVPTPDMIAREIAGYKGDFWDALKIRAPHTLIIQTQALIFMVIWRIGGLMLLGMGLMKTGFFSGKQSIRFYLIVAVLGFVLGLPLCIYGVNALMSHNFDIIARFQQDAHYNYFGSIFLAFAYVSIMILLCKSGFLTGLFKRFAAVGRMALSNYLLQTIIFTTVFYGYGLGLFSQVERSYFPILITVIWATQLLGSFWWLKHFMFGPVEWVWRSLTYRHLQPFRFVKRI